LKLKNQSENLREFPDLQINTYEVEDAIVIEMQKPVFILFLFYFILFYFTLYARSVMLVRGLVGWFRQGGACTSCLSRVEPRIACVYFISR